LHNLSVNEEGNRGIKLDEFLLEGVTGYKIESSADGTTELTLKMVVSGLMYSSDKAVNDLSCNLSQNVQ
jgi:hypothetical protein